MSSIHLNYSGLICPMPIIQLQKCVRTYPAGTQLHVTCTDPGTEHDIPAWCRIHGYTASQVRDCHEQAFCFNITLG